MRSWSRPRQWTRGKRGEGRTVQLPPVVVMALCLGLVAIVVLAALLFAQPQGDSQAAAGLGLVPTVAWTPMVSSSGLAAPAQTPTMTSTTTLTPTPTTTPTPTETPTPVISAEIAQVSFQTLPVQTGQPLQAMVTVRNIGAAPILGQGPASGHQYTEYEVFVVPETPDRFRVGIE
ncbi:MAG: hypothetical protein Q8O07_09240 [Chloroflexota bacterium]|nr:hypothetical protein [Chloroflexota bacterium]